MNNLVKAALLSFVLTGCSSMSPIEKESESKSHFDGAIYQGQDFYISPQKIEGERYRIFHQASTGFSGTGGIRRSATQRANQFCSAVGTGKKMQTVSEHTAEPPYVLGNFPRIEIIFVCVDAEDAESSPGSPADKYDRIVKIKDLYDRGALSKEEFESEKKKILSQ